MKTDKGQFDAVLRRMLDKPPQKTADIHKPKKAHRGRLKSKQRT
jgi:hypothetical protein